MISTVECGFQAQARKCPEYCFKRKIDDEDIMPLLESVLDHPNERVRNFAIGTVHEETIQGMAGFIQEFQENLSNELHHWQKRLKFETIQAFDLCCLPWFCQIELNFLTTQEDFDRGKAYEEGHYYVWRLKNLPHHGMLSQKSVIGWVKSIRNLDVH